MQVMEHTENDDNDEYTEFVANSEVGEAVACRPLEVVVGDRGIERAIKHLKRKMASEGILRELKRRRHHMKPSIKKRKKQAEAARRRRKRVRTEM
jgi:small subunit ribosomal protein S21